MYTRRMGPSSRRDESKYSAQRDTCTSERDYNSYGRNGFGKNGELISVFIQLDPNYITELLTETIDKMLPGTI
jgi:hypothetical protein